MGCLGRRKDSEESSQLGTSQMVFSLFSIGLFLIFLGSPPFEQARGQTPPPPPLGSRPTNPPVPNASSSPSSTGNAGDLTGVWIMENRGNCWYDRRPNNRVVCDTLVGKLELNEAQGKVTGKYFGPSSPWLRPKPDEPYTKVNNDGSHNIEVGTFDGTTLRLSLSYKLTPHPQEKEIHSLVLTFDKANPNVLTGTRRNEKLNPNGNDAGNFEVRFNRQGGAIVRVRNPTPGGPGTPGGSWVPWIPWILIPGLGWVIYTVAKKGPGRKENEPKEYELDIRTEDDRTSLNTDGEDILWVYAQVRCNKPEVDTVALTSNLTFTTEGTDAKWLSLGAPEKTNGFKTVPVRAWPPSENAQLAEGKARVMVSAIIEGSKVGGPAELELGQSYVMEFVFPTEESSPFRESAGMSLTKEPPLYTIPCDIQDPPDLSRIEWRETPVKCLVRQMHGAAGFAVKIDKVVDEIKNPSKGVFSIKPPKGIIEGFSHVTFTVQVDAKKTKAYLKREYHPFLIEVKVEVDPLNMGLLGGALPPLIATAVNKATKKPQVIGKTRIGIEFPPPLIWIPETPAVRAEARKTSISSAEASGTRCNVNLLQYNKQAEKYEPGNEELEITLTKNEHKVQFEIAQIDASGFYLKTKRVIIGSRLIDAKDSFEKAGEIAIARKKTNKPPAGNQPMKVLVDYQPIPSATISAKIFVNEREAPIGSYEALTVSGERVQIRCPKLSREMHGRVVWKVTGPGRVSEQGSGFHTEETTIALTPVIPLNGTECLGATIDIVDNPLTEADSPIDLETEAPEYKLNLRTQDERTTVYADGEDILWVHGQVQCNKAEVDTAALTSALVFEVAGPNAEWLLLDSSQSRTVDGFKVLPVRARAPSEDAELLPDGATVTASTTIQNSPISGSVMLSLAWFRLEVRVLE